MTDLPQDPTGREMRGTELTISVTCCTGCGCLVGKDNEDWDRHLNWHRLLRNLTTDGTP